MNIHECLLWCKLRDSRTWIYTSICFDVSWGIQGLEPKGYYVMIISHRYNHIQQHYKPVIHCIRKKKKKNKWSNSMATGNNTRWRLFIFILRNQEIIILFSKIIPDYPSALSSTAFVTYLVACFLQSLLELQAGVGKRVEAASSSFHKLSVNHWKFHCNILCWNIWTHETVTVLFPTN